MDKPQVKGACDQRRVYNWVIKKANIKATKRLTQESGLLEYLQR